ncbi:MAG: hypothetical protein KY459_05585 [Acidobacteria bacterium]|nr:hypothetical protein [Acidobacteriota bacterium]
MKSIQTTLIGLTTLFLVASCASVPITTAVEVPPGSEIGIISLRDCVITGQEEDCTGSGEQAAEAFAEAFNEGTFEARVLDRPVADNMVLSDEEAAEYGRAQGVEYVINGEVDDFYSVAAMTFRSDRAAVSVRLIRTSDGLVVTSYSRPGVASSNFVTPKGMIKDLAIELRNAL